MHQNIDRTLSSSGKTGSLIQLIKEYNEIIKQTTPELIEKDEYKREELLKNIEHALQKGENPNAAETGFTYDKISANIYPLHMAIDEKLTALLLKYGANQNIRGYVAPIPDVYMHNKDDITALEAACLARNYAKAKTLLCSSFKPDVENVENALLKILEHIDEIHTDHVRFGFQGNHNNPEEIKRFLSLRRSSGNDDELALQLEILRTLSEKSSEQFLFRSLRKDKTLLKMSERIPGARDLKVFNRIRAKCDIYADCLSFKLILSIWLIVSAGQSQNDSGLDCLPKEIISTITSNLFRLDMWEIVFSRVIVNNKYVQKNPYKLDMFKKIYPLMVKYDTENELSKCIIQDKTDEELVAIIQQESKQKDSSLIKKTWELVCVHYDNFSSKNDYLVEKLTIFSAKNSKSFPSNYKFKMFDKAIDPSLLSIKMTIINELDALAQISEVNEKHTTQNLNIF